MCNGADGSCIRSDVRICARGYVRDYVRIYTRKCARLRPV
jgi:hypothetical protein